MFPIYFVVMFSVCYISAFHKPTPHNVEVAIIGPSDQTAPIVQALAPTVEGQFKISQIETAEEAQRAVRNRDISGAFAPGSPPTLYYAGAVGAGLTGAVQGLFRSVAAAQGQPLTTVDLVPLASGDPSGTGIFYFTIICTLGGYLTVTILGQAAPNLPVPQRLALIGGIAIFTPVAIYLIGGVAMDLFDLSFGQAIAVIAIGALYSFGIGLVARGLQLIFGSMAIIFMMLIFVFLNFPSAGGAIPPEMLPSFWRFLNHFWIGATLVKTLKSVIYFDNQDLLQDLAILVAWVLAWLIIFFLPVKRIRRRAKAGDLEAGTLPSPVQ
jgi:hypothetical protein